MSWSRPTLCTAHRTPHVLEERQYAHQDEDVRGRARSGDRRSVRALHRRRQRARLHRPPRQQAEALRQRHGHGLRRHPVRAAERRGPQGLPGRRARRRPALQRRGVPLQPAQLADRPVRRGLAHHQGDRRAVVHLPLAVHRPARHDGLQVLRHQAGLEPEPPAVPFGPQPHAVPDGALQRSAAAGDAQPQRHPAHGPVGSPRDPRGVDDRRHGQRVLRLLGRHVLGMEKAPHRSEGPFRCAPPGTRTPDPLIKSQLL
ncbi:hypothetical protein SGPA1_30180 [Streptomyces misionensis JCM 4497]